MLTVLEAITKSTEYLQSKGIESARLNAEMMLAHILKCKRLQLYLLFDRPLSEEEISVYREFLKRRSMNEPLQYILGTVEFYGLEFLVDKSVLIPRPETELLVETVIEFCKKRNNVSILDVGTGSGNIAISIAKHIPYAEITAIDSSAEAIKLGKENEIQNDLKDRIIFGVIDIFDLNSELRLKEYDVIVSNPPYISEHEFGTLAPELRVYEPKSALTDYSDGYNFYRRIISCTNSLLKKGGQVFFELGAGQSEKVKQMLLDKNFSELKIKTDYLNIERVISGVKN